VVFVHPHSFLRFAGRAYAHRAATFNPALEDLLELARAAQESIDRSTTAIDAAVAGVAKSNARIKAMETKAGHAATGSRV
jgi:hypothetical protein